MNRLIGAAGLVACLGIPAHEAGVTTATGTFDVTVTRQSTVDTASAGILGRMSLDKRFHGDLEGTSRGEMLTGMTAVRNSAGYVAIERVSATLHGRRGTFILQHSSTMHRGTPQQSIIVIPDSGTDQLEGLTGSMIITITDGKHYYSLEYTLPAH